MHPAVHRDLQSDVIVGVDTHKFLHVAVAINSLGAKLGQCSASADRGGYAQLDAWARTFGEVEAYGIEGTGSYGAGLTSFLRRQGHKIVEVNRADRRMRRANGKSDSLDAEAAARAVLSGTATAVPKVADGTVEMIRQIKIARDTARKSRTQAMVTLKALTVNSPAELREQLAKLTDHALLRRCAAFRPGPLVTPSAAAKHALRALARRCVDLDAELRHHETALDTLTASVAPTLRDGFGIGVDTAAEMLLLFGDDPGRVRSEAAFAKLCGVCPQPAASGVTNRHRLNRGGHRQANAALYRATIIRMRFHQPTIDYVARRTTEGLSKKDVIRCLKRYLAREVYRRVTADHARNLSALAS